MEHIQTELYEDVIQPKNFIELIEIITYNNSTLKNPLLWRGQSNINWRIDHSAYRRLKLSLENVDERSLTIYETALLNQATHKGFRNDNGKILTDFELLAKLQHHGAATRLLDFSKNPLIALWFCCSSNIKTSGLLLGIDSHYIGGGEGLLRVDTYKKEISENINYDYPFSYDPTTVTPRITSQTSQFLYSTLSNDKKGSLKLPKNNDSIKFLSIKKELKLEFLKILNKTFNINSQTIFPDIDGFCKSNSHSIEYSEMFRL